MDGQKVEYKKVLVFAVNADGEVVVYRENTTKEWTVPSVDIVPDLSLLSAKILEKTLGLTGAEFETPDLCVLVARQWEVMMECDRSAKSVGVVNPEILKNMIDNPTIYGEINPVVHNALVNFFAKKHNV